MNDIPAQQTDLATLTLFERLVRLPLQIASELAAARDNELNLHADMPCMLALMFTIHNLAGLAQADTVESSEENADSATDTEQLDDAANASCLMVLQRAGVQGEALAECLHALHAALDHMIRHGVLGPQAAHCHTAWPCLRDNRLQDASNSLRAAIHECVHAVDEWEADENRLTH